MSLSKNMAALNFRPSCAQATRRELDKRSNLYMSYMQQLSNKLTSPMMLDRFYLIAYMSMYGSEVSHQKTLPLTADGTSKQDIISGGTLGHLSFAKLIVDVCRPAGAIVVINILD